MAHEVSRVFCAVSHALDDASDVSDDVSPVSGAVSDVLNVISQQSDGISHASGIVRHVSCGVSDVSDVVHHAGNFATGTGKITGKPVISSNRLGNQIVIGVTDNLDRGEPTDG